MIDKIIANAKWVFSFNPKADSDEHGMLLASYVIMMSGVALLIFTGIKQVINLIIYRETLEMLLTFGSMVDVLLAGCVLLMGASLMLSIRIRLKKSIKYKEKPISN